MPVFKYKAALKNGKHKKGIVDAASRAQAARKLREDGLYPIDITPMDGPRGAAQRASLGRFAARLVRRVPRDALAATVRQLAILLKATIPLDKALGAVIKDDRKQTELQRIISEVRERIREGGDLASAFAQYPHVFNSTFVTMVQAGE
ncbi:MAG: type II secretion system F family protein [Desulfovibrionaceae bacterium]